MSENQAAAQPEQAPQVNLDEVMESAAKQMIEMKKSPEETLQNLREQGIPEESAAVAIQAIREAVKERGNKDMLYGGLWFVGGVVATVAEIGYIFWGAIVFGAIQFIQGYMKSR